MSKTLYRPATGWQDYTKTKRKSRISSVLSYMFFTALMVALVYMLKYEDAINAAIIGGA